MARPEPKVRPNFKTADFYAAFAKTLRTIPPPTPAAAAAANTSNVPAASGGTHVYPSPAVHATSSVPSTSSSSPSVATRSAAYEAKPVDAGVPKPVYSPPPAPAPTRSDPPKPASASSAAGGANTGHLEAEITTLKEALRRKEDEVSRARAEASRRAAEIEELKTAKIELERERNNLYKRVAVVEKKLERGTHHKDGQKRHDRSQTAIALYDFSGDTSMQQLQFKKGDLIKIKASHESGWWTGRLKDDTVGFFPVLYVQVQ